MNAGARSIQPTRGARYYAIRELARRAGVTTELFGSWRVAFQDDWTDIFIEPGTDKYVRFPNAPAAFWRELTTGRLHSTHASWMSPPPERVRRLVPGFVIPFSNATSAGGLPLFFRPNDKGVHCSVDLLASLWLSLARFEELICTDRDAHGRFPARCSVAVRDGFLMRPIVDEYGLAFEQAIACLLPYWRPVERRLRVKISHDIDWTGVPSSLRPAVLYLLHTLRHSGVSETIRELMNWVGNAVPTCLKLVQAIAEASLERGLDAAVYWMAAPPSRRDSGYDLHHPRIRTVIAWLRDHGVEMGVHPSYRSFLSAAQLRQEVESARSALGERQLGGRQHYLRWTPESWLHWEMCELAYDSTVGYAEQIGFRAGTCFPYRPWLLTLDREANLFEIPLIVMDETLVGSMGLTPQQSLEAVRDLVARCRIVGGVFTLLWHNDSLIDPRYGAPYTDLLDTLVGSEKYDWRTLGCG